jgi:hypothetical protein
MSPLLAALIAHGIIGGVDVLVNHEWLARLHANPRARLELGLHSAREGIFAVLFIAVGWFEWHGLTAVFIAALLLGEILVSLVDTVIEPDIRLLPRFERALHVLLFINMGIILVFACQGMRAWLPLSTELVLAPHGWPSWILSALACGALAWSVRDAAGAFRN